jgi:hypothetical protein
MNSGEGIADPTSGGDARPSPTRYVGSGTPTLTGTPLGRSGGANETGRIIAFILHRRTWISL